MPVSKMACTLKFFSRLIPRKLIGAKFSLKQETCDIIEKIWNIAQHDKPIFRRHLTVEDHKIKGLKCEMLYRFPEHKNKIIVYFHGGGYLKGNLSNARNRSMRYPIHTDTALFVVNYRISPIAPFPAALEDGVDCYKYILKNYPDSKIIFIGDSAGGGLALSVALNSRDTGIKTPDKIILNSPWTDLTCSLESHVSMAKKDVVLTEHFLQNCSDIYCPEDKKNPYASPIFADFHGIPPIDIHVGSEEVLLCDSTELAKCAEADGVKVKIKVWEGMFHMFHFWEAFARESEQVCKEIYDSIDAVK